MGLDVYNETRKIWDTISTAPNLDNLDFDLHLHKKLLDIFQVGSYYYMILDVRNSEFDLVSPEIETVLGYPVKDVDLDFYLNLLHPEDLPFFLNFERAVSEFFNGISDEKMFRYKVQYDFRIRKADGHYIRVLNQIVILHHDVNNVRTFVINTDITNFKKESTPMLSFVGMDGEPSFLNVDIKNIFKPTHSMFTKREKDILKALASGMSSFEIGFALNISKFTVDSHRKNMLKKTEARSTNEIISIAFNNGWV